MKRGITFLLLIALCVSFASAEIIFNQQPKEVYSLGDVISLPTTIKSSTTMSGIFDMNLLCKGHTINFYKNGVSLKTGEEKKIESSLILTKNIIGELKGDCKIKAILGETYILTNNFKISDLITININFEKLEFNPGENFLLEGSALKENGEDVNGYISLLIKEGNETKIDKLETINNGFFTLNATFPKDMKAGTYLLQLDTYEEDASGEKTNKGFLYQNIIIKQIPTSLEIVFEDINVEPGTNLKVKAILHDQTGEKINATSFLTIKNDNDKILEQKEILTDEFLEFPINYNTPPAKWTVVGVSTKLTSEGKFNIIEKESVDVAIVNKTVIITNTGNVLYNKTVLVKIGNESLNVYVYLKVDGKQKYILTAPDGEYQVEIIAGTDSTIADVALTGKTIDVKKTSKAITLVRYPLVWIFLIVLLGFVAFVTFKRGYNKTFLGYISSKMPKKKDVKDFEVKGHSKINSKNKAELSLSIKGDKQNVSLVALKIKNLKDLHSKKGNAEETLQEITNLAEENKAVIYENHNNIFFILAPTNTRTFGNEKTALKIAKKVKEILDNHNKMSKQKIDFGIGLTYGTIVAKNDKDSLKFMTLGTLMNSSKKISSASKGEILLDDKINPKLTKHLKTKKHEKENLTYHSIKEEKNAEENEKFIKHFLHKIEKDKKK